MRRTMPPAESVRRADALLAFVSRLHSASIKPASHAQGAVSGQRTGPKPGLFQIDTMRELFAVGDRQLLKTE